MYDIDAGDLINFATRWSALGDAVTEQVARVIDNPEEADVNPAAIRLAAERLDGLNEDIDCSFAVFFEYQESEEE